MSNNESVDDREVVRDDPPPTSPARRPLRAAIRLLPALAILAVGGAVSFYWLANKPHAKRQQPQVVATLVEAEPVDRAGHRVTVRALGTVEPAASVQLASRVGGEVVSVSENLIPGGRFKAGEVILNLDAEDYELAVEKQTLALKQAALAIEQCDLVTKQRKSDVARAEAALALERGQQDIAKREYELLGEDVNERDKELILRQPQLKTAQAAASSAVAATEAAEVAKRSAQAAHSQAGSALREAQLHLKRTRIVSPFNAVVRSRSVNLGSQVSPGAPLATLVETDEYWVRVSIPMDQLRWIDTGGRQVGSSVRIYHGPAWGEGVFRVGKVERLMTEVEPQGQMAQLLVTIKDPLGLDNAGAKRAPMVLGSYVRVEIEGRELTRVVRLPRSALRDGKRVWLMKPDATLHVRDVAVVWSGDDWVCVVDDFDGKALLVTSDLAAPVQGMALRRAQAKAAPQAPDSQPSSPGHTEEGSR